MSITTGNNAYRFLQQISQHPNLKRSITHSTWSDLSHGPIWQFKVEEDLGIPLKTFSLENKEVFKNLSPDLYDVRREQIEFLQDRLPASARKIGTLSKDYFIGTSPFSVLSPFYSALSKGDKTLFNEIKPFRFRAISRFHITQSEHNFSLKRQPLAHFTQELAANNKAVDWRKQPRVFSSLENRHVTPSLKACLIAIGKQLHLRDLKIGAFDIAVHHVKVITAQNRIRSNSPEGIHQDGYPYLATALVVERENISGGESEIFDEDKTTLIFKTTLGVGEGILQPDLGTKLWHRVSSTYPTDPEKIGVRSIIGFDIGFVKEKI
jgi:hypothetical protein